MEQAVAFFSRIGWQIGREINADWGKSVFVIPPNSPIEIQLMDENDFPGGVTWGHLGVEVDLDCFLAIAKDFGVGKIENVGPGKNFVYLGIFTFPVEIIQP